MGILHFYNIQNALERNVSGRSQKLTPNLKKRALSESFNEDILADQIFTSLKFGACKWIVYNYEIAIFRCFERKYFNPDGSDCYQYYFHNLNEKNKPNFNRQQGGSMLVVRGIILQNLRGIFKTHDVFSLSKRRSKYFKLY